MIRPCSVQTFSASALLLSVAGVSQSAAAAVVSDDFNSGSNPGYFFVAKSVVPNPTLDFSGGNLSFSTDNVANNTGGNIAVLNSIAVVRPFTAVDLPDVGDFIQASFNISAPGTLGEVQNVPAQLRGLHFTFIGAGDETLPSSNTTYPTAQQDFLLAGSTAYNLGVDATVGNTQVNLPVGNLGGSNSIGNTSQRYFVRSNGVGGTFDNQFGQVLTNGTLVTLRLTRAADDTSVAGSNDGPEYLVTLTYDDGAGMITTESAFAAGQNSTRLFGTTFSQFAIGTSDVYSQANGVTAQADFSIDNLLITTNIPEPASLALLGLGTLMLLPRKRR